MGKKGIGILAAFVLLAVGVLVSANAAQAKTKTKKYSVTLQKGVSYTVAALEEDLEPSSYSKKKFPVSVTDKRWKWKANSKKVKVKGKVFTVKKKGTYRLTGTYKKNKKSKKADYKYVITVKAVTKKKTVTEKYELALQVGETYSMKTAAKDLLGMNDKKMLYYVYNKQNLTWKAEKSPNLEIKGNQISAKEVGTYTLIGYNKYNKTYRYEIKITAYASQLDTKPSNVKRIEITSLNEGKKVTIDDTAKITEFCNKFSGLTYQFDYEKSNHEADLSHLYSVSVYSDGAAPACQFTVNSTAGSLKVFRGAYYKTDNPAGFDTLLAKLYSEK